MRAEHLKKQTEAIDNIYKAISEANANGQFKIAIPHFMHVSDEVKLELIENGYKVYIGDWDGVVKNALIIEW